MAMIICIALIQLAAVSVAFSRHVPHVFSLIPMEYNCAWEEDTCTDGRIFMRAVCNCNCPGYMLCCDPSILEVYDYPTWRGMAPFCTASCDSCGPVQSLCWWQSRCGDGDRCLTGNKYLCGRYKCRNSWPFLDEIVSCNDVEC